MDDKKKAQVVKNRTKEEVLRKSGTFRKVTLHAKKNQLLKSDQISIKPYEGSEPDNPLPPHETVFYLSQFINVLKSNITDVNKLLSTDKNAADSRIRFTGNENFTPAKPDLVFTFQIKLRSNSWM